MMVWHYNCDLPAENEQSLFHAITRARTDGYTSNKAAPKPCPKAKKRFPSIRSPKSSIHSVWLDTAGREMI